MTFIAKSYRNNHSLIRRCECTHLNRYQLSFTMPLTVGPAASATALATDRIDCYCSHCRAEPNLLLTCRNAWSPISSSYFLNVIERDTLQDAQGIRSAENRLGSGQVEGCQLETLRCTTCTYLIGTRCVVAAPDKSKFQ